MAAARGPITVTTPAGTASLGTFKPVPHGTNGAVSLLGPQFVVPRQPNRLGESGVVVAGFLMHVANVDLQRHSAHGDAREPALRGVEVAQLVQAAGELVNEVGRPQARAGDGRLVLVPGEAGIGRRRGRDRVWAWATPSPPSRVRRPSAKSASVTR